MKDARLDRMYTANACLECRKVKMKCYAGETPHSKCQRCDRKSLDCEFRAHRRGRRPGTRLSKVGINCAADKTRPRRHHRDMRQPQAGRSTELQEENDVDSMGDNLQPSGVLNRQAMKGKFSLGHLLEPNDSDEQIPDNDSEKTDHEDPILLGLVNFSLARSLYDSFILVLNPFISQLDPALHTFTYAREKSSFLLTAVLTASAKVFHPILYQNLYQHSQNLYTTVFRNGTKSVEVVQAILILTYWKELDDNRVWTSVGYVIRICMDLGWHRLEYHQPESQLAKSEIEQREIRNIERTWLVLFVYDKSISLQTGKPYMIEPGPPIESIEPWARHPLAIGNDRLLGALVTLRLETTPVFISMFPQTKRSERSQGASLTPLLSIINRRIEKWEATWSHFADAQNMPEEESCHAFLIRFYGSHLRLQLFSLQVQDVLSSARSSSPNLDSLWIAYSSALRMLRLIPRYSSHLGFVQDSVHIMLAYSAAFLVKLLLRAPREIVEPLELDAIAAIRDAAATFTAVGRVHGSSCALQAKFLDKILVKMSKTQNHRVASTANIGHGQKTSAPVIDASEYDLRHFSQLAEQNLELPFSDCGSWDEIFASAGLNMEEGLFQL